LKSTVLLSAITFIFITAICYWTVHDLMNKFIKVSSKYIPCNETTKCESSLLDLAREKKARLNWVYLFATVISLNFMCKIEI